jgi:hypothetical protein
VSGLFGDGVDLGDDGDPASRVGADTCCCSVDGLAFGSAWVASFSVELWLLSSCFASELERWLGAE